MSTRPVGPGGTGIEATIGGGGGMDRRGPSRPSGEPFNPLDNPDVVEIYNAYDTSKHTYVAARTVDQYSVTSEIATIQTTAAHGFLVDDVITGAGIATGVSGDKTVISVPTTTTYTVAAVGVGDIGDTGVSGTANWKNRKVSQVAGMRGLYDFTQGTLANMPQWDDSAKGMSFLGPRQSNLLIDNEIKNAIGNGIPARSVVSVSKFPVETNNAILGTSSGNRVFSIMFVNASGMPGRQIAADVGPLNSSVVYSNVSNANGNTKLIVVHGATAERSIFVNNMVTAASTNTNNGTVAISGNPLWIGRNVSGAVSTGMINFMVFLNDVTTQTYRENTKQWLIDNYGVTFG